MIFGKKNHGQFWEKRVVFEQPPESNDVATTTAPRTEKKISHEEAKRIVEEKKEEVQAQLEGIFKKDDGEVGSDEQDFVDASLAELENDFSKILTEMNVAGEIKKQEFLNALQAEIDIEINDAKELEDAEASLNTSDKVKMSPERERFPNQSSSSVEASKSSEVGDPISYALDQIPVEIRGGIEGYIQEVLAKDPNELKKLVKNIEVTPQEKSYANKYLTSIDPDKKLDTTTKDHLASLLSRMFIVENTNTFKNLDETNGDQLAFLQNLGFLSIENRQIIKVTNEAGIKKTANFLSKENLQKMAESMTGRISSKRLNNVQEFLGGEEEVMQHIVNIGLYPKNRDYWAFQKNVENGDVKVGEKTIQIICDVPRALAEKREKQLPQWEVFLDGTLEGENKTNTAKILTEEFDRIGEGENTKYYEYNGDGTRREVSEADVWIFLKGKGIEKSVTGFANIAKEQATELAEAAEKADGNYNLLKEYADKQDMWVEKSKEASNMWKEILSILVLIFKGNNILEAIDQTEKKMILGEMKSDVTSDSEENSVISFEASSTMHEKFWKAKPEMQKEIIAKKLGVKEEDILEISEKRTEKEEVRQRRIVVDVRQKEVARYDYPQVEVPQNYIREENFYPDENVQRERYVQNIKLRRAETALKKNKDIFANEDMQKIMKLLNEYGGRDLISAVIAQESAGDENAVSRTGATGLMQLTNTSANNFYKEYKNEFGGAFSAAGFDTSKTAAEQRENGKLSLVLGALNLYQNIERWHEANKKLDDPKLSNEQIRWLALGEYNGGLKAIQKEVKKIRQTPEGRSAEKLGTSANAIANSAIVASYGETKKYIPAVERFFQELQNAEKIESFESVEKNQIIAQLEKNTQAAFKEQLKGAQKPILGLMVNIQEKFGTEMEFTSTHRVHDPKSDHGAGLAVDIKDKGVGYEKIAQYISDTFGNGAEMTEKGITGWKDKNGNTRGGRNSGDWYILLHPDSDGSGNHLHISYRGPEREKKNGVVTYNPSKAEKTR